MSAPHPAGVYRAALTPLKADLSPDLPVFVEHAQRLIAGDCEGIALLGTTGEADPFSTDERRALHHADPSRATEVDGAQARIVAKREQSSRFARMASLEALIARETGHAGWTRLHPPLLPLNAEESERLLAS